MTGQTGSARMRVFVQMVYDLKNNKQKTREAEERAADGALGRLQKWLRKLEKGSGANTAPFKVGWAELLEADERGRWWLVGSAWAGRHAAGQQADKDGGGGGGGGGGGNGGARPRKGAGSAEEQLQQLATAQRMNTDVRRALFRRDEMMGADLLRLPLGAYTPPPAHCAMAGAPRALRRDDGRRRLRRRERARRQGPGQARAAGRGGARAARVRRAGGRLQPVLRAARRAALRLAPRAALRAPGASTPPSGRRTPAGCLHPPFGCSCPLPRAPPPLTLPLPPHQCAYWDELKEMDAQSLHRAANLAKLLAHLLGRGALSLALVRVVEWHDLPPRAVFFWQVFFTETLSLDAAMMRLSMAGLQEHANAELRDGVLLFVSRHLRPLILKTRPALGAALEQLVALTVRVD